MYVPTHFLNYHHKELNCIACHAVNKWCMHIAGLTRVCAACCTGLVPLPCVVCNRPLECCGGDTLETCIFSEGSRFLCCGADAHRLCRMQFLAKRWPKCPACPCYLEPNGKLHVDFCGTGDHIFARRERTTHDIRRRMGKDYSYVPRL